LTLIFKSNVSYAGALELDQLDDVAYTAQQLFDIHEARVIAAGGTVADEASAVTAIGQMQDARLLSKIVAWASPSWGSKITSTRYDNLYSIRGVDFEGFTVGTGGAKPLTGTDAAGNVIAIMDVNASRVGGLFRTESDVSIAANSSDWFCIFTSMSALDALTAQIAFGNLAQATTGFICANMSRSATLSSITAQESDYNPAIASDAGTRLTPGSYNSSALANTVGMAFAMNISTGVIKLIMDGNEVITATSATGTLYDYVTLARRLYLGSGYDGSANITSNRKGELREAGIINDATLAQITALTLQISERWA
jgi:hypothetical protein